MSRWLNSKYEIRSWFLCSRFYNIVAQPGIFKLEPNFFLPFSFQFLIYLWPFTLWKGEPKWNSQKATKYVFFTLIMLWKFLWISKKCSRSLIPGYYNNMLSMGGLWMGKYAHWMWNDCSFIFRRTQFVHFISWKLWNRKYVSNIIYE